ncbi:helix-turn-helix domain-containing protein [Streptomyces triticirhizae]|uniref:Helix-turn-helix domain-containing protein n=1 Tax=Streptomyces triticirhizae TaxID=2483353 RepID=A0A3M2LBT2_9ACTN|nr:helix-turn-helix transcriptional regulator [Streptomyces triticirhizae]RMI34546.1 helix-turn-helix domain-containing protein [Streptomyces triticirhizae]
MSDGSSLFGPELRRLRLAAGWTLDRLAGRVHYSKSHLSKVETGQKRPTPGLARLCDVTLEAGGVLAALVPERPARAAGTPPAGAAPVSDEGEVWVVRMDRTDGSSHFAALDRRQVAMAGAGSILAVGLGGPRAAADATGSTLLEAAGALLTQFRGLGQASEPGLLIPALAAQTHGVEQLARRSSTPRARRELLVLAARFAEYTGWMAQESGNDEAALWWTDRAVALAEAGDDPHLAAYGLVRRGLVSLLRGDVATAAALTERALASPVSPRVRGLAAQHLAQARAVAGDERAAMSALDRARELLNRAADVERGAMIGASHVPDLVTTYTAWCLHELGQPARAAELYARESARVPAHALRSGTRNGVRLALAHATAGEIDACCAVLAPLLGRPGAVRSATIAADLRRTARVLGRHRRHPAVRELGPDLAAALTTL